MNQNEVNRIITEKVLGECYHIFDNISSSDTCVKCKKVYGSNYSMCHIRSDFSTWSDYGPLLEKIQGETWWEDFVAVQWNNGLMPDGDFLGNLLNPTKGSHAIAEFVKDREVK